MRSLPSFSQAAVWCAALWLFTTPLAAVNNVAIADDEIKAFYEANTFALEVPIEDQEAPARLWIPMRGALKVFPFGFALCHESFQKEDQLSLQSDALYNLSIRYKSGCFLANYLGTRTDLDFEITRTDSILAKFSVPASDFVTYPREKFVPLRTDRDQFVTATFDDRSLFASEFALVCNSSLEQLVRVEFKEFGTQDDFAPLADIASFDRGCSILTHFNWEAGKTWETRFTFAGGTTIRYVAFE